MGQAEIMKILSYDKYITAHEIYEKLCKKGTLSRSSMNNALYKLFCYNEVIRRKTKDNKMLYEYIKSRIY